MEKSGFLKDYHVLHSSGKVFILKYNMKPNKMEYFWQFSAFMISFGPVKMWNVPKNGLKTDYCQKVVYWRSASASKFPQSYWFLHLVQLDAFLGIWIHLEIEVNWSLRCSGLQTKINERTLSKTHFSGAHAAAKIIQ